MRQLCNALVLGGAGFLGSALSRVLAEEHMAVTVVDRARARRSPISGARIIEADVATADLAGIAQEEDIDVVFHLAGSASVPPSIKEPHNDLVRNTATTIAVLEQLRRLDKPPLLVFTSSAAVYGNSQKTPIDEEHPVEPVSPYGVSKLAAEHYVRLYVGLHGLSAIVARPFSIYGPGQRKLVVHDLIARVRGGEDPLQIAAPAEVTRDFVYVNDAARGLLSLARSAPGEGEAYNLASGTETTLRSMAEAICDSCGAQGAPEFSGIARPGDPLRWVGDPARARALGASFDTPLSEGIRETVAWYDESDGGGVELQARRELQSR